MRTKWRTARENVRVNDLVLIRDENTPPLKWPLGRVVETVAGDDGLVRVVIIRTADGTYKRAVAKVCKLPIESPTEQE